MERLWPRRLKLVCCILTLTLTPTLTLTLTLGGAPVATPPQARVLHPLRPSDIHLRHLLLQHPHREHGEKSHTLEPIRVGHGALAGGVHAGGDHTAFL